MTNGAEEVGRQLGQTLVNTSLRSVGRLNERHPPARIGRALAHAAAHARELLTLSRPGSVGCRVLLAWWVHPDSSSSWVLSSRRCRRGGWPRPHPEDSVLCPWRSHSTTVKSSRSGPWRSVRQLLEPDYSDRRQPTALLTSSSPNLEHRTITAVRGAAWDGARPLTARHEAA